MINGTDLYLSYGAYRYMLSALMALILLIATSGNGIEITIPEAVYSALAAAALAVSLFCSLEAMKSGAMVLVNLAGSAGLLIPCVLGIFMFDETMSLGQVAGIAGLLTAAYLLAGYSRGLKGNLTPRTILLLAGAMLSNGTVMLAQKMFSLYAPGSNAAVFSLLTFGIAGTMFTVPLSARILSKRSVVKKLNTKLLLYGAVLSAILLVINQLSTMSAAVIPSAVLFSVNDGGSTIISGIVAAMFFGEKLTLRSTAGILLGILSLVAINLL